MMTMATKPGTSHPALFDGVVAKNVSICSEHFRLTIDCPPGVTDALNLARAGQFVHLAPPRGEAEGAAGGNMGTSSCPVPLLRRAFSIAGLRDSLSDGHFSGGGRQFDVMYRVVGTGTRWLSGLRAGDALSVMGALGNGFPISDTKRHAWLVAGGVGLPPMLWLAEALGDAVTIGDTTAAGKVDREVVAFAGARSVDLLALTVDDPSVVSRDAGVASLGAKEFADVGARVVIATDDGSLGFHGHVAGAMGEYYGQADVQTDDLVVYTCGPEVMMRAVAEFCVARSIECHVCMERAMACGTGTCQSCVVAVQDESATDGWRYELCCDDGPVFDAERLVWG